MLPFAVWYFYINRLSVGEHGTVGIHNFAFPFTQFAWRFSDQLKYLFTEDITYWNFADLIVLVSLLAQAIYLIAQPKFKIPIWRVGFSYAVLMLVLGQFVYMDALNALSRIVLPLTFAFNILLPRSKVYIPLLIIGNLSVIPGLWTLDHYCSKTSAITFQSGSNLLDPNEPTTSAIQFGPNWHSIEGLNRGYWRWSSGSSTITVDNPSSITKTASLSFEAISIEPRNLALIVNDETKWNKSLNAISSAFGAAQFEIRPGSNQITFATDLPGTSVEGDPRKLAFRLVNYRLVIE